MFVCMPVCECCCGLIRGCALCVDVLCTVVWGVSVCCRCWYLLMLLYVCVMFVMCALMLYSLFVCVVTVRVVCFVLGACVICL